MKEARERVPKTNRFTAQLVVHLGCRLATTGPSLIKLLWRILNGHSMVFKIRVDWTDLGFLICSQHNVPKL